MNPTISVIIPLYNVEQYLTRCVDSILNQDFADLEVILVNDGSSDRSGEICDAYQLRDSRVKVIHQKNGGPGNARNTGIAVATGEYIAFIDSDDYAERNMLRCMHTLATENNAEIAVCGVRHVEQNGKVRQPEGADTLVITGIEALREALSGKKIIMSSCNKLIKRSLLTDLRFVEGHNYEDVLFSVNLFLSANTIAVTERPLYNYCHRAGSLTRAPFSRLDMDAIYIYKQVFQLVQNHCPELIPVAQFRLQWAHFAALDKILAEQDYRANPALNEVVAFLRAEVQPILVSPLFSRSRKIFMRVLCFSVWGYRVMLKLLLYRNGRKR